MSESPKRATLHELFAEQVRRTPDAIALRFSNASLSYAELNRRANRLAHHLQRLGVGPEVLVGLYLDRSMELVVGMLAILKAGGAYVPVDPAYPPDRIAFMLQDTGARITLTQAHLAGLLDDAAMTVIRLDADAQAFAGEAESDPSSACGPDNLAYVIYTSGSTGRPKGVLITHHNVVRLLQSAQRQWFDFDHDDVWTLFHSHAFDFSVWEMWGAFLFGGRLVVVPYAVSRSPEEFYRLVIDERVTVLNQTPTAFGHFMQAETALGPSPGLAVRYVLLGAEALDFNILDRWFARHGDAHPRLYNMYGITETTVIVTFRPLHRADIGRGSLIGAAIPDLQMHLLDEAGRPVADGDIGEICVGGAGVARGYLNRPDLNAERFVPDPFSSIPGALMYRSGDLARRVPDGDVEYLGRRDTQVKIRGFRIELGEIEAALARHPAVHAVTVVAKAARAGDLRLVAYLVWGAGGAAESSDLRQQLRRTLPEYMVPARFIALERLPMTAHGKVDRQALAARDDDEPAAHAPNAPMGAEEAELAAIWQEVLGVTSIGAHDRFDDLGGNSLLAMKIAARVRGSLCVEMPLVGFLGGVTIADQALALKQMRESAGAAFPPLARAPRDAEIPASFAQEIVCFMHQLHPESVAYQFIDMQWITGPLQPEALQRALNAMVRRHEVYRTTFPPADGKPVQRIHEPFEVALRRLDLTDLPEARQEGAALEAAREEARHGFDPERLPLARWTLIRLGAERHALIHVESHLVHDGWSFNVLLSELKQYYDAYAAGIEPRLPPLEYQFADFAAWQRAWAESAGARRQIEYWKRRLAGSDRQIALPLDRPHPPLATVAGEVLQMRIGSELTAELASFGRNANASLFMITLAAFAALLHRHSGETDMNIGSGFANRRLREFEGILGMFVNTVVLRLDLAGDPSFAEFVARVRAACLDAYENQDIPFERVVAALNPPRTLQRQPLFQVMFSFHDAPLADFQFAGTRSRLQVGMGRGAKADLNLVFVPGAEALGGSETDGGDNQILMTWEYNTALFDQATVRRLAEQYLNLLAAAVRDPAGRLRALPL